MEIAMRRYSSGWSFKCKLEHSRLASAIKRLGSKSSPPKAHKWPSCCQSNRHPSLQTPCLVAAAPETLLRPIRWQQRSSVFRPWMWEAANVARWCSLRPPLDRRQPGPSTDQLGQWNQNHGLKVHIEVTIERYTIPKKRHQYQTIKNNQSCLLAKAPDCPKISVQPNSALGRSGKFGPTRWWVVHAPSAFCMAWVEPSWQRGPPLTGPNVFLKELNNNKSEER